MKKKRNRERLNAEAPGPRDAMRVHLQSGNCEWATPMGFFRVLDAEFGPFDLAVCASPGNAKCANFYDREIDGLLQTWAPRTCWMNPPYGRTIGLWMRKAYEESLNGALVVCLVPARTDTAWWHDYALRGVVRFVRGRLRFSDGPGCAPFPSAVVVFRGGLS